MSTPRNRRIKTNSSLVRLRDDTLVLFKDRVASKVDVLVGAETIYEPPTPPEPNVFYVVDENGVAWLHKPDSTWTLQNDNIVIESWQKLWDAYGRSSYRPPAQ